MKRLLISLSMFCGTVLFAQAPLSCSTQRAVNSFPLVTAQEVVEINYDASDFEVVKKASALFVEDVQRITNRKPQLSSGKKIHSKHVILIGTLGHNEKIDKLIEKKQINVDAIRGQWERFMIKTVKAPEKGVDQALVIVGSDRRATAYGILTVSEAIGVSPWYWWADIPEIKHVGDLYLNATDYTSKKPSVQYRGFFLNDEGWGLFPWASKTDDAKLGDIGPKTYAKVCELLLRLKANLLCPAMHPCSGAFYTHPENKLVADSFAILVGSSHCEPLLFNNTTEWFKETMGEWNYVTNKKGINEVLNKRVAESAPYENIYTVAMRGIHDGGLVGVKDDRKVNLMTDVIKDQRAILTKYIQRPADSIPQIFVPYKEVLDIYEKGLKVPDDITIVWPDDNFGYIKRLSNAAERERSGRAGVYYHLSYLGEPHDYLWLNTTPSALIYEEMRKAYDTGADRYWLLNVGDIKPSELGIHLFMNMAWDIDRFGYDNINDFNLDWLASIFGTEHRSDLADILGSYYQLAFQRKPEAMGWGIEWNNYHHNERVTNTDFSFINYNEAENRIREYDRISDKAKRIYELLPPIYKPSFYELVYYPVKGAALMNKKMLGAQKNRWYATQGRAATALWARNTQLYKDSLDQITADYNNMLNGKWKYMMSLPPGWTATYMNMPELDTIPLMQKAEMEIFVPGQETNFGVKNVHTLPCFNPYTRKDYFVEIYNKGEESFHWKAITKQNWMTLSKTNGEIDMQERIIISVDWAKAPIGEDIQGEIVIEGAGKQKVIYASLFNPATPTVADLKGMYVEDNGCISIDGGDFHRMAETDNVKIEVINGLGYENHCVQLGKATDPVQDTWFPKGPRVEYDFYAFNSGRATVYTYALPLFAVDNEHDTRYGIMIDDGWIHRPAIASKEYSGAWLANVIRNSVVHVSSMNIDNPGKHTLKILCVDPGMIIQKIVIDMGGMKRSYLGVDVTKVK